MVKSQKVRSKYIQGSENITAHTDYSACDSKRLLGQRNDVMLVTTVTSYNGGFFFSLQTILNNVSQSPRINDRARFLNLPCEALHALAELREISEILGKLHCDDSSDKT